jgi:hypothetical protein
VIVGIDRSRIGDVAHQFPAETGLAAREWLIAATPGNARRLYEMDGRALNAVTKNDEVVSLVLRLGRELSPWRCKGSMGRPRRVA